VEDTLSFGVPVRRSVFNTSRQRLVALTRTPPGWRIWRFRSSIPSIYTGRTEPLRPSGCFWLHYWFSTSLTCTRGIFSTRRAISSIRLARLELNPRQSSSTIISKHSERMPQTPLDCPVLFIPPIHVVGMLIVRFRHWTSIPIYRQHGAVFC